MGHPFSTAILLGVDDPFQLEAAKTLFDTNGFILSSQSDLR
jgi:hypothetical protein